MVEEISRYAIEQWIRVIATGEFHYRSVLGLDRVLTPKEDGKLRKIVWDLCHTTEPIVESVGRRDGYYRPVENNATPLDWQGVVARQDSGLVLPVSSICFRRISLTVVETVPSRWRQKGHAPSSHGPCCMMKAAMLSAICSHFGSLSNSL